MYGRNDQENGWRRGSDYLVNTQTDTERETDAILQSAKLQRESKKQSPVHFTAVSTHVDHFYNIWHRVY